MISTPLFYAPSSALITLDDDVWMSRPRQRRRQVANKKRRQVALSNRGSHGFPALINASRFSLFHFTEQAYWRNWRSRTERQINLDLPAQSIQLAAPIALDDHGALN
jgi:hypothetical protein